MKTTEDIIRLAIKTLHMEAEALLALEAFIDQDFVESVKAIYNSKGRVIITGIGKSAIIANKIVATFNSTGTPAIFMHAADAIHGDLGMIQQQDIVICISKSGNTPEIKILTPLLKKSGNLLIGMVGNTDSYLAKQADFMLNTTVAMEACPNNLAPTTSTTAQLAMGDALAVCLLDCRDFKSEDFAKYHPGGALGKKLYLKVADIVIQHEIPQVNVNDSIHKVIIEISSKRMGITAVMDGSKLAGVITDGDIRRMLENEPDLKKITASSIMNHNPKLVDANELAVHALDIMQKHNISQLLVTNEGNYKGAIHLHDLIREGII